MNIPFPFIHDLPYTIIVCLPRQRRQKCLLVFRNAVDAIFGHPSKGILEEKKFTGLESNVGFGKEDRLTVRCRLEILLAGGEIRLTKS